jgi:hypothetical protein
MTSRSPFSTYRPQGDIQAAELTPDNLDALAKATGAQVFTAPERKGGARYLLLEGSVGSFRVELGDFLVQDGDRHYAVPRDEFLTDYAAGK